MSFLERDLADILFEKLSLYMYERDQKKERKSLENEKKTFIKNNTVIVIVNGTVIYDSSTDGVMNDDLYNALISYGAKQDAENHNTNNPLVYNLNSSITPIISQR